MACEQPSGKEDNKWEIGRKGSGCTPSHRGFLGFFYILYISSQTPKCPNMFNKH